MEVGGCGVSYRMGGEREMGVGSWFEMRRCFGECEAGAGDCGGEDDESGRHDPGGGELVVCALSFESDLYLSC